MLKEKIQADIKEAMKSGNSEKKMVLSLVLNAIKNKELEKRTQLSKTEQDPAILEEKSKLSEDEVVSVISSEVKKRKESAQSFKSGGRPELAEKEESEINILVPYLPEQMSEEDIRAEVKKTISELSAGPKDAGKVIGSIMARVKGKADGQVVSKLVKEELG